MNIAGYAQSAEDGSSSAVLLPVGTRQDVRALLALVVPAAAAGQTGVDPALLEAGLSGSGPARGFVTAPRAARWLDPWAWRRNGYAVTDRVLLARTGLLDRHLVVVPARAHPERRGLPGAAAAPARARHGPAALHARPGEPDGAAPGR